MLLGPDNFEAEKELLTLLGVVSNKHREFWLGFLKKSGEVIIGRSQLRPNRISYDGEEVVETVRYSFRFSHNITMNGEILNLLSC